MMSLVATPVVAARVTAPKKAARKMTVKASMASDGAKSAAIAGAVSLTMVAQPAVAAIEYAFPVPAAQEIAMVADAGDDAAKKAKAKALALSLQNDLVAQDAKEGKIVTYGVNPTKTKNLAFAPSASISGPSFSLPKLGGGEKKAPNVKGEQAAPAPKSEVSSRARLIASPHPRVVIARHPGDEGIKRRTFGILFSITNTEHNPTIHTVRTLSLTSSIIRSSWNNKQLQLHQLYKYIENIEKKNEKKNVMAFFYVFFSFPLQHRILISRLIVSIIPSSRLSSKTTTTICYSRVATPRSVSPWSFSSPPSSPSGSSPSRLWLALCPRLPRAKTSSPRIPCPSKRVTSQMAGAGGWVFMADGEWMSLLEEEEEEESR